MRPLYVMIPLGFVVYMFTDMSALDIIIPAMLVVYVVTEWIIPVIEAIFHPTPGPAKPGAQPTRKRVLMRESLTLLKEVLQARRIFLVACWSLYALVPLITSPFYLPNYPTWREVFHFGLGLFGYGVIGCWLYALTGSRRRDETEVKHTDTHDRLIGATIVNM